jgi:hypothetical protein
MDVSCLAEAGRRQEKERRPTSCCASVLLPIQTKGEHLPYTVAYDVWLPGTLHRVSLR